MENAVSRYKVVMRRPSNFPNKANLRSKKLTSRAYLYAPSSPIHGSIHQPQSPLFVICNRSHEAKRSQLAILEPHFQPDILLPHRLLLQERQPGHGFPATSPAKRQESKVPSDDGSGEEVRPGEAAVAFCVVQVGERAV